MWAILALDLSADTALFKLRKIHHYQISGGMFIELSEGATADKSRAIITHVFHSEHTDHTPTGNPLWFARGCKKATGKLSRSGKQQQGPISPNHVRAIKGPHYWKKKD